MSQARVKLYVALVHYPVLNKRQELTTTSVTNLDIHDISRASRTFGVEKYFIVTPLEAQHHLMRRILGHWEGSGGIDYNPDRHEALKIATPVFSVQECIDSIHTETGTLPLMAVTATRFGDHCPKMEDLYAHATQVKRPVLLLFGTGHGLAPEICEKADIHLARLAGAASDGYNHLSVRAAVAIYLDRWSQAADLHS